MGASLAGIIAFIFIFFWVIIVPIYLFVVVAKRFHGRNPRQDKAATAEEARLIQEIYQGLQKMNHRIEALETLLMDSGEAPLKRWGDQNNDLERDGV